MTLHPASPALAVYYMYMTANRADIVHYGNKLAVY